MPRLFTLVTALFSSVIFSSAVIAHTLTLPHSHDSAGVQVSQGLVVGGIVLVLACLTLVRIVIKMR